MADLPDSAFWRYSVALYARPGVAPACLVLQDRFAADVNLILLGLWLGAGGHRLGAADGDRLARVARPWQRRIVAPLRRVRRRLKAAGAGLPWGEPVEARRRQLAAVELAMEQVEQLLLEQALAITRAEGAPDREAAQANLTTLGLGRLLGSAEATVLLDAAFGVGAPEP